MEPDHVDEIISAWGHELPEIAGLPLELAKRSALLVSAFDVAASAELEKLGLTQAEYGVLATLRRIGAPYRLKPTDLTHALLLSSGGTSNVVKRLVAAGHVTRAAAEDDARSSWVQLTPSGVETAEAAVRATTAVHARLVDRIPERTAKALSEQLRIALAAIEEGVLIRR
ncbi:MarR family winged helix-turn-helix transcriptional regulator [Streptomyces angustmyceticus]|uniref:MarR family winged helix-turn-helix transcriptional regulator n=1 Tax=Streptomyces angustmyceticus TaxID=285578 RepID=UPI0021AF37A5|nr:MarR family transcriptional regulator [Streptomyces angustmyceticus]